MLGLLSRDVRLGGAVRGQGELDGAGGPGGQTHRRPASALRGYQPHGWPHSRLDSLKLRQASCVQLGGPAEYTCSATGWSPAYASSCTSGPLPHPIRPSLTPFMAHKKSSGCITVLNSLGATVEYCGTAGIDLSGSAFNDDVTQFTFNCVSPCMVTYSGDANQAGPQYVPMPSSL